MHRNVKFDIMFVKRNISEIRFDLIDFRRTKRDKVSGGVKGNA